MRTGGSKKTWTFDTNEADLISPIRDRLIHHDVYFAEEYDTTTLAIVLDHVLADLPAEQADCVRLVYLEGRTYREAGRQLNIDHKTVKARAERGVEAMRRRLVDSVWISEMLKGYIPKDELTSAVVLPSSKITDIVMSLKGGGRESQ